MEKDQERTDRSQEYPSNKDQQGNDKAPGEEVGKGEEVKNEDLKDKTVDRDPPIEFEQPIRQLP